MTTRLPGPSHLLLGVDLGGSKIAATVMEETGAMIAQERVASPKNDYDATLGTIASIVDRISQKTGLGKGHPVGIGTPGSINPQSGLLQNANSTWLNGQPLLKDLETRLQRPVRIANDADCFALSEAHDGAGRDARSVFGVILGTGCGGGFVLHGELVTGNRGINSEWGHNPLPWAKPAEIPGPHCWCGHHGCMETWISGPALESDYKRLVGTARSAKEIAALGDRDEHARIALHSHVSRLARGLAAIVNMVDPDVIVLGGGLSAMAHLYDEVPHRMAPYIFSQTKTVDLRPPDHGDASGVRGAARLWRERIP